jgi:hypothetical protein
MDNYLDIFECDAKFFSYGDGDGGDGIGCGYGCAYESGTYYGDGMGDGYATYILKNLQNSIRLKYNG